MPHRLGGVIQDLIRDESHGLLQSSYSSFRHPGALAEIALPQPGGTLVGEQAQQVAYNAIRRQPLGYPTLQVGEHRFEHLPPGAWWDGVTETERIGFGKQIGLIIGCPAKHCAINLLEMRGSLLESRDAAIDLDAQRGEVFFQPIHVSVA